MGDRRANTATVSHLTQYLVRSTPLAQLLLYFPLHWGDVDHCLPTSVCDDMTFYHPRSEGDDPVVARYANYFQVGQNAAEFILDCGQVYSEAEEGQVHTRIVTGPPYAKALLRLLQESIDHHEQIYGEIREE